MSGLSSTLKKIKELLEDPPRPKVPFEPLGGLVQLLKKNKDVVKSLRLRLSNVQTPEEGCELKARLEEQEAHVKALELTYATALANACRRNPEQTGSTWGWM